MLHLALPTAIALLLGWGARAGGQVIVPLAGTMAAPVPPTAIQQIGVGLVAPIHVAVLPNSGKVMFLERINGGAKATSHVQEFDPYTGQSRALQMTSDAFCSTGFISPDPLGRLFNVGGWDGPALEAIRYITPCGAPGTFGQCNWAEDGTKAALKVPRWYPSALPLANGRFAIMGGTTSATGMPEPAINQPNVEWLPPYVGEQLVTIQLLVDTDQYNLYPIAHLLPTDHVFLLAGQRSQLLNPYTFAPLLELPPIGQGRRTYPLAGSSVLLPLSSANKYTAEVLVCGGGSDFNMDAPALDTCGRIAPTLPNAAWLMETMPLPRLMPDMTIMADGRVLIINGAANGWGGFANAANPVYQSVIYDPDLPVGARFSLGAASTIARLYHSESVLLEDGRVLISGSTPNADADVDPATVPFPNEVRVEAFYPAYLTSNLPRPQLVGPMIRDWQYGQRIRINAYIPSGNAGRIRAALFTNGFVTHSTHQGQRYVRLDLGAGKLGGTFAINLLAPPTPQIAPPGWYMLFVLDGDVPAIAQWVRLGGDPANLAQWV